MRSSLKTKKKLLRTAMAHLTVTRVQVSKPKAATGMPLSTVMATTYNVSHRYNGVRGASVPLTRGRQSWVWMDRGKAGKARRWGVIMSCMAVVV